MIELVPEKSGLQWEKDLRSEFDALTRLATGSHDAWDGWEPWVFDEAMRRRGFPTWSWRVGAGLPRRRVTVGALTYEQYREREAQGRSRISGYSVREVLLAA